jgi:drug/metabolite transporter (DMT)-like permease
MTRLPAARVALLQFVYPAVAVLVDWAVYGRALQPLQWLGVLVMGIALAAARRPGAAR